MENNNYSYTLLHEIEDIFNDEIDIIIDLQEDNSKYHVTFVTYKRVQELMNDENKLIYYSNIILIESLTEENINYSIKNAIDNGIYLSVFYPINNISINKLNRKFDIEQEAIDNVG